MLRAPDKMSISAEYLRMESGMIRIADFCDSLLRMNAAGDDIGAFEELDKVCLRLFGSTLDHIKAKDFDRLNDEAWSVEDAIAEARTLGYDLTTDGKHPLTDWEDFWLMIRASHKGLLPNASGSKQAAPH